MGLGLAKSFVIFLVVAGLLSYITKNIWNGVVLIVIYAVVKMFWIGLTGKNKKV